MKWILITGANGNLGGCLVKELADNSEYGVIAVANSKEKISEMLERESVENKNKIVAWDQEDFFNSTNNQIYAAVHMAFSRANKRTSEIASSLDYAEKVFKRLKIIDVKRVVYISSQSVYGSTSEWRKENQRPEPNGIYPMAKYAGEKLLEMLNFQESSSLRLDYVIQSQRLVYALCKDVREKREISLRGGKQTFSYIDRKDVARAIVALLNYNGIWKPIYNVGPNRMRYSLIDIAELVKEVAKKHGVENVAIRIQEDETELWSGMDCTLFEEDTGWKPSINVQQMVEAIYKDK